MRITSPNDMIEDKVERIIKYIESLLIHQPKNQNSYTVQIPEKIISHGEILQIENEYVNSGWATAIISHISQNLYKLELSKYI